MTTDKAALVDYDGWKATSPANAIVKMLDFHGDRPSERVVEIDRIIKAAQAYLKLTEVE